MELKAKQLSTPKQSKKIVDFLMKHPTLATCTVLTDGRQRDYARRLWGDLASSLNNLEGAHYTPGQWRRVCSILIAYNVEIVPTYIFYNNKIWLDMKHSVRSKLSQNSAKKKNKMDGLDSGEQRIANILLKKTGRPSAYMCKCDIEASTAPSESDSEEYYADNATIELAIDDVAAADANDFPTEKHEYTDIHELCVSPPQISNTDTQEESQMCISKSLQDICQQNAEILQHVRQTYHLMAEESKRQQAYQSSKLVIYRKKLELLHTKLEMDKLISFSKI